MSKKQNVMFQREVTAKEMADRAEQNLLDGRQHPKQRMSRQSRQREDERREQRRDRGRGGRMENSSVTRPTRVERPPKEAEKAEGKARKRIRKPVTLPPHGQPGGLDDPLRRGLSGAGVRWYLRHLTEGMPPEEARKKAVERKVPQADPPQGNAPKKRGASQLTPQKEPDLKRRKVPSTAAATRTHTSYAEAASSIKVAILPKEQGESLSADELTTLEEAIVGEMMLGAESSLQFAGIHFRPGMLVVDCVDKQTADWLVGKGHQLAKWEGKELRACMGDDIPRAHVVTIFFPRSNKMSEEQLLSLVKTQNRGLNTQLWKILSSKEEASGKLISISIDEESRERILDVGGSIFFRFGKLPVHGLRRKPEGNKEREEACSPASPEAPTEMEQGIPSVPVETNAPEYEMEQDHPSVSGEADAPDISSLRLDQIREEDEERLLEGKGEIFLPQSQQQ